MTLAHRNGTVAPSGMSENATAFSTNAAAIDLCVFILVWAERSGLLTPYASTPAPGLRQTHP